MAKIGNLKNNNGEIVYPITRTNLVLDENGKNADELYAPKNDEVYNFAKEEYDKTLNLVDIKSETVSNNYWSYLNKWFVINLPASTYTFSFKSNVGVYCIIKVTDGSIVYEGWIDVQSNGRCFATFTTTNDFSSINFGIYNENSTFTTEEFTFCKGTNYNYIEYYGNIVHEKDIEPILIWENASPSADFSNPTITIQDSTNYKYLIIIYRQFWTTQGCAVAKFRLHQGTEYCLSVVNNGTSNNNNYARGFNETNSTTITWGYAYDKDKNIDNKRLIPLEMYLSNY